MEILISNENYLKAKSLKENGLLKIGHVGSPQSYNFRKIEDLSFDELNPNTFIEITVSGSNFKSLAEVNEISIIGRTYDEPIYFKKAKKIKYAVISYWVGEYEPAKTWIYDSYEEASKAMKRLYEKSYKYAEEDENFEESVCFIDDTSAKIAWCDGLERWFEVSEIRIEEEI